MNELEILFKSVNERLREVNGRLDRLESKIDDLMSFRWKSVGVLTVLVLALELGFKMFGG